MSERTWRDVQAERADPLDAALTAWNGAAEHSERVRMTDALDAFEEAAGILNFCDEPGCENIALIGFPAEGGYRRTCFEHDTKAPRGEGGGR